MKLMIIVADKNFRKKAHKINKGLVKNIALMVSLTYSICLSSRLICFFFCFFFRITVLRTHHNFQNDGQRETTATKYRSKWALTGKVLHTGETR